MFFDIFVITCLSICLLTIECQQQQTISLESKNEGNYERVPLIKMAFGVMIYQKNDHSPSETYDLFYHLMQEIYDANHFYVLHVDSKSDVFLRNKILAEFCHPRQNCHVISPRNVAWASLSTGEMMLALMQEAFESGFMWEKFLLVGHESMALTSIEYLEHLLVAYPLSTNFMNCWPIEEYNFFGQMESLRRRVEEVHVDNFQGTLLRTAITRSPPPIKLYKSLQLTVLSREFAHYAVWGRDTRLVMLYLANIKTSDEMLLPTLLQMHPTLSQTATCNSTLHFNHWIRPGGSWHPEYLSLLHLPLLLRSEDAFARKVSSSGDGRQLRVTIRRLRDELRSQFYQLHERAVLLQNASYFESPASAWLAVVLDRFFTNMCSDSSAVIIPEVVGNLSRSGYCQESMDDGVTVTGSRDLPSSLSLLHLADDIRRARDWYSNEEFRKYQKYLMNQAQSPKSSQ